MTTSLVDELQIASANAALPVAILLRRALLVASKLELSDIPEWISKELSGYSDVDTIPSHRVLHGAVRARVLRRWIPVQFPTSQLANTVSQRFMSESVAEIESLTKAGGQLAFGFAPEAQQILQNLFRNNVEFVCFIEKTRLEGILDEVRNQVLRWAIALDKAGVRGEGMTFTNAEKEKAHSMTFHVENGSLTVGVVGNVGGQASVATGLQPRSGGIDASDVQRLAAEIGSHADGLHLGSDDKNELVAALAELQVTDSAAPIEPGKVRQALGRVIGVIGKAGETVITVGVKAYTEAWMKQHGIGL